MLKAFYTAIAFLLLTAYVHAQVVNGTVVDAETGTPIANASIYLKGLSKGTTSNSRGEFTLKAGETKAALIVSFVGYQSDTILNYSDKLLTIRLKPRASELSEVVIGADDGMNRERKLRIFIREFIGSNSNDCIITNPDDIKLRYKESTKTLVGEATRPLIILNKRLGYKITYYLSAFSHSPIPTWYPTETTYKGNYVFEEDTLGLTTDEIKKIHKARDKAYYGSKMHFIRSVFARDLEKNNFDYQYYFRNEKWGVYSFIFNNIKANQEKLLKNTFIVNRNGVNYLSPFPCMYIAYNHHFEPQNADNYSYITFKSESNDEPLTPVSYNEIDLVWSGNMARQRVSELLPIDFEPSAPPSDK